MATLAYSAPAPAAPPPCPLPANASPDWLDLWASLHLVHARVAEAVAFAYAAGVDPRDLSEIQLVSPRGLSRAMPRLAFGARIFSPAGEVTA